MIPILIRGATIECEKAKKVLRESNIDFAEINSLSHLIPTLIVEGKAFSYKGLSDIKAYACGHSKPRNGRINGNH